MQIQSCRVQDFCVFRLRSIHERKMDLSELNPDDFRIVHECSAVLNSFSLKRYGGNKGLAWGSCVRRRKKQLPTYKRGRGFHFIRGKCFCVHEEKRV